MSFPIRMLNGVGVVATSKRPIKSGKQYDAYFPKPSYSDPLFSANGENEDTIMRYIPQVVEKYHTDTVKIASVLKQSNLEGTCKAIFDFIYNHIQYNLDSSTEEQIRRPARSWADRYSGVDCDCYTVFISSILSNLSIPHFLRMSAYNPTRGYQHIYVIVPKTQACKVSDRQDYWTIDPVLNGFDQEKPFLFKKDKFMGFRRASTLNGFPIRMLNGDNEPSFKKRSNYVWDEIHLHPELNTWSMRGLDGGYYLQADPNMRYVQPLSGVGETISLALGFVDPATMTAAGGAIKIGKKIGKVFKGIFGRKKKRKAKKAAAARAAAAKSASQAMAQKEISTAPSALLSQNAVVSQGLPEVRTFSESQALPSNNNSLLAELFGNQAKQNGQETAKLAQLVTQRTVQANNNTVRSLDAVDKSLKQKIDAFASKAFSMIDTLASQGREVKEITENVKQLAKNEASKNIQSEVVAANQKTENFQKNVQSQNKYLLIGLVGVGVVMMYFALKKSKQP